MEEYIWERFYTFHDKILAYPVDKVSTYRLLSICDYTWS